MNRLSGKTMLITGAGAGLGRQVAIMAAREGARVMVTDKVEARIGPVVDLIREAGGEADSAVVDVTDESQIAASVALLVERYGQLDVMFANAGMALPESRDVLFEDLTREQWNKVHDVNLLGTFLTIKHAARTMRATSGGSIVVTSSAASLAAYPGFSTYVSSKAGVNGLVRSAAYELGRYGIRVNAVCPTHGMSVNFRMAPEAPVLGQSHEEAAGPWNPARAVMPLRLPFPPSLEHNAWPVIFLASDESQYMSGVCIPTADGGQHARTSIPFPDAWPEV